MSARQEASAIACIHGIFIRTSILDPDVINGCLAMRYVLTDSTIDYNDRTVGGEWHGRASKYVESLFLKHDINASVDAVCGSGFVAGASDGQHFRNRLLNHLSHSLPSAILFMGGWNDVHRPRVHVLNAIYNCVSIARSGRKRRALPVQYDP